MTGATKRSKRVIGAVLIASLPGLAQAQTAAPPPSGATAASAAASAPGASNGEIIVTATRQAQSLQKVPLSVSAFSQQSMDVRGLKDFADVARFTPGVRFGRSEGGAADNISIRGISSDAGAGTTGIYIDDTPIQIRGLGFNSENTLPAIFDLERVEVLRGPQGTLFGAGSEGGTVRFITPQPNLQHFQTYDRGEIASTAHGALSWEAGSAIGGPIVKDKLGFRISAWHRRDGGYIDHVDEQSGRVDDKNINHGDTTVLRAALTYAPIDELKITPSVHYQKRDTHASDNFFVGLSDPGNGVFRTSTPEYRGSKDRFVLPSLNIHYDFSGVSLISNTSYFKRRNITGYSGTLYDLSYYQSCYLDGCGFADTGVNGSTDDNPGPLYPFLTPTGINKALPFYLSPSLVTNTQRIWTQEARLQSDDPNARLSWVVGVFYQHTKQRSTEELVDPLGNSFFQQVFGEGIEDFFGWPLYVNNGRVDSYINSSSAKESQIAAFANLTYHVTDQLSLTAGGRKAKTKFSVVNFADGSQNAGRTEGSGKESDSPFTPKLGINFQADRNNLVYASWSKGFRAAGANPPVPIDPCADDLAALGLAGAPTTYKSDKVTSWEVGSKNKLFGGKLTIDASIYTSDWNNIQQIVNLPTCAIRFIANVGKARSRGFDLQASISPVRGVTLDAAIGYTHTRYTADAALAAGGQVVVTKGDAIDGPPWTLSFGAQYDFPVNDLDFYVRGDVEYQSRLKAPTPERDPASESYDPALIAPAANTFVSLRAGALVHGANVSLFVDNLFDSAPQLGYTHEDADTALFENSTFRPRTVGMTVTYRK
ncbi:MAG: TonB-dependent receptor [Sphingomonadaceae bacterium]|nr:TonB-dependent receptor [Sphingomonadaceae bacterium]